MNTDDQTTLILSGKDVQEIAIRTGLNSLMDDLIDRLDRAIKAFDPSATDIPRRSGFHYQAPKNGLVEWMPLYHKGGQVMMKIVGYHPTNPDELGLPTIISTLSAYDTDSGHLSALMDGVLLTAMRTGASSAVASSHLAHRESGTLGLIGCGVQGLTQLHAISRVFEIEKVLIFDNDPKSLYSFVERTERLGLSADISIVNVEEIITESDILSTATSNEIGAGPLFTKFSTKPHLHVNAVGSDFPGKIELPVKMLRQATVIPDFIDQAVKEGECQQLEPEEIGPSLFELVQDERGLEELRDRLTIFDSTGWALEDYIVMDLFLEKADELGVGSRVAVEALPHDSKNPYAFYVSSFEDDVLHRRKDGVSGIVAQIED